MQREFPMDIVDTDFDILLLLGDDSHIPSSPLTDDYTHDRPGYDLGEITPEKLTGNHTFVRMDTGDRTDYMESCNGSERGGIPIPRVNSLKRQGDSGHGSLEDCPTSSSLGKRSLNFNDAMGDTKRGKHESSNGALVAQSTSFASPGAMGFSGNPIQRCDTGSWIAHAQTDQVEPNGDTDEEDCAISSQQSLGFSQLSLRASQKSDSREMNDLEISPPNEYSSLYDNGFAAAAYKRKGSDDTGECDVFSSQEDSQRISIGTKEKVAEYVSKKQTTYQKPSTSAQQSCPTDMELCTEDEASKRQKSQEKNRKYARESRDRKNKKMESLEQETKIQECIIEIYKKLLTLYHKRLTKESPSWVLQEMEWYTGQCTRNEGAMMVKCYLPVLDQKLIEDLGNGPYGKVVPMQIPVKCKEEPLSPPADGPDSKNLNVSQPNLEKNEHIPKGTSQADYPSTAEVPARLEPIKEESHTVPSMPTIPSTVPTFLSREDTISTLTGQSGSTAVSGLHVNCTASDFSNIVHATYVDANHTSSSPYQRVIMTTSSGEEVSVPLSLVSRPKTSEHQNCNAASTAAVNFDSRSFPSNIIPVDGRSTIRVVVPSTMTSPVKGNGRTNCPETLPQNYHSAHSVANNVGIPQSSQMNPTILYLSNSLGNSTGGPPVIVTTGTVSVKGQYPSVAASAPQTNVDNMRLVNGSSNLAASRSQGRAINNLNASSGIMPQRQIETNGTTAILHHANFATGNDSNAPSNLSSIDLTDEPIIDIDSIEPTIAGASSH